MRVAKAITSGDSEVGWVGWEMGGIAMLGGWVLVEYDNGMW